MTYSSPRGLLEKTNRLLVVVHNQVALRIIAVHVDWINCKTGPSSVSVMYLITEMEIRVTANSEFIVY